MSKRFRTDSKEYLKDVKELILEMYESGKASHEQYMYLCTKISCAFSEKVYLKSAVLEFIEQLLNNIVHNLSKDFSDKQTLGLRLSHYSLRYKRYKFISEMLSDIFDEMNISESFVSFK